MTLFLSILSKSLTFEISTISMTTFLETFRRLRWMYSWWSGNWKSNSKQLFWNRIFYLAKLQYSCRS